MRHAQHMGRRLSPRTLLWSEADPRVHAFDGACSPERAAGMLAVPARARADAASGAPLAFDLLSSWQRVVPGISDTPFRSAPAFAKQGRERYGTGPGLRGLLRAFADLPNGRVSGVAPQPRCVPRGTRRSWRTRPATPPGESAGWRRG